VLRSEDGLAWRIVTAYFPYEACSTRANRRWLGAVNSRIDLYTRERLLPTPVDSFDSADPLGVRCNIRFVAEHRWGFRDGVWCRPGGWPLE